MDPFTGLSLLFCKMLVAAAVLERVVAQVKNLTRMTRAKPWPLVALVVCSLFAFGFDLGTLSAIVGHPPSSPFIAGLDRLATGLLLSGGASGLVDLAKGVAQKRNELHQLKLGG